jgi:hypothetical protein
MAIQGLLDPKTSTSARADFPLRPPRKFPATWTEFIHFIAGIRETVAMKKQFQRANEKTCRSLQTLSQKLILNVHQFGGLGYSQTNLHVLWGKVN